MTRILRVITRLNVGGPARQVLALATGLREHGFETAVAAGAVAEGEEDMSDVLRAAGVEVVAIPGLGRAPRPLDDVRALAALVRLVRERRPAIVHTHTAKGGALGRVAARAAAGLGLAPRPRLVHTFHGHVLEGYFGPLASAAVRAAERALAQATDRVVCLSPLQRRDLVERFRVVPARRAVVIPPGLDLEPYSGARKWRGEMRDALGLPPAAEVIGLVGRLVPIKAVEVALDAFAEIARRRPAAFLLVAGDGPERPALEAHARAAGLEERVRFLGVRRDPSTPLRAGMLALYGDLDLLLISSRAEGTPLAAIEAMAAGVPVVAFGVGGVPDVVPPEAGVLLPPSGGGRALAAAATSLLEDPARRAALAAVAPAAARRFGAAALAAAHAALYRDLLGGAMDA